MARGVAAMACVCSGRLCAVTRRGQEWSLRVRAASPTYDASRDNWLRLPATLLLLAPFDRLARLIGPRAVTKELCCVLRNPNTFVSCLSQRASSPRTDARGPISGRAPI